jgi:hypothetical protein
MKAMICNFIDVNVRHVIGVFIFYYPKSIAMLNIPGVGCQEKNNG